MPRPFFSIIIPTYNSAGTLSACIESIITQSFNNWEILIVDAVSKDDTTQLAASYAATNPSIRIVSEKDKGIYDAMNKGINLAAGEWLYFMGSDDKLFDVEVLQNVAGAINNIAGVEIVYGNVFSERFNGLYDGAFNYSKILKKNISHQAIFFNKKVFDKTGYFNLDYKAQSDWDHNLKWLLAGDIKKQYINTTVAFYADGGFSSLNGDDVFYKDIRANYLSYGKKTLPLWKKLAVLIYEMLKSVKRGDIQRAKKVLKSL